MELISWKILRKHNEYARDFNGETYIFNEIQKNIDVHVW